ncbi:CrcB family protein [Nocardioides sp. MH1]|uniref:fluoride efflux transporter FluC n=1 Tax=Nocardioides sp. MH1 TaxID=3242490 RepID=UPI00352030A9
MTVLLVAVGAAVGAPVRFTLGKLLDRRLHHGTLLANTLASLVLGLVVGWSVGEATYALVATGFCGGMSTYSSFAVQARDQGPRLGLAYVAVTIALGLAAATLGYVLAQA